MMPRVDELEVPGARLFRLAPIADERGSFTEVFRQQWFPGQPAFEQGNLSRSSPGVLRGMHYHLWQADLWVPVEGRATVGLCDLRRGSPTDQRAMTVELEPGVALYLPPGIAHGFSARTPFTMLYLVDRAYDGSDEHGFSPLDPAVGIDWPAGDVVLSERDRTAPSLADALVVSPVDPWVG